jgi:hypothetical protein
MHAYDARLKLTKELPQGSTPKSPGRVGYPGLYKAQWTEFEVQTLAYGILRKHLYPTYLVRGEYQFPQCRIDIAVFKPAPSKDQEPTLLFVIEVKKTTNGYDYRNQQQRYQALLGVPCVYIKGGHEAYNVLELVSPYLNPELPRSLVPNPSPTTK